MNRLGEVLLNCLPFVLVLNRSKDLNPIIFSNFDPLCVLGLEVFVRLTFDCTASDEMNGHLPNSLCLFFKFGCV